ncbi:hypothetical protein [Amycolatopsis albispora]|uniref:DUF5642 domain-containing protein n=1 Tax=Amycolatopsis albispora TaxID=1804986 RepID=A0A344LGD7_9PSEU|nr:hypothetical protein [Amycolatopsis albispora]AXB47111.1 hypothetical protein A4R43_35565 [Amycolatopsis albispora]
MEHRHRRRLAGFCTAALLAGCGSGPAAPGAPSAPATTTTRPPEPMPVRTLPAASGPAYRAPGFVAQGVAQGTSTRFRGRPETTGRTTLGVVLRISELPAAVTGDAVLPTSVRFPSNGACAPVSANDCAARFIAFGTFAPEPKARADSGVLREGLASAADTLLREGVAYYVPAFADVPAQIDLSRTEVCFGAETACLPVAGLPSIYQFGV